MGRVYEQELVRGRKLSGRSGAVRARELLGTDGPEPGRTKPVAVLADKVAAR